MPEPIANEAPESTTMSTYSHVMDGHRVLDFTQFVAGPVASQMLAEMGAEVIKVEIAPNGDGSRVYAAFKDRRSAFFVQHNRGKKSLCINPKAPAGLEILRELIARVDVFIENFTPGVIARMGLGYEVVRVLNPRIVMCSLSSFGQSGPLARTITSSLPLLPRCNGRASAAPCSAPKWPRIPASIPTRSGPAMASC
jgi:crotonobetainyl-CoA:carnitine CoA-transferase CaiB-like acyl-CoA transferase